MSKPSLHKCHRCQHPFPSDKLQCPSCKAWNIERPTLKGDGTSLLSCEDDEDEDVDFIQTGSWDPCFGRRINDDGSFTYGIPKASVTLLGGKNGAGKSTLVLQICEQVCKKSKKEVLIVSVEEAKKQVRRLGKRLKLTQMGLFRMSKGEVDLADILHAHKPALIVVDSLPRLCPNMDDAVEFVKRLKAHVEALDIPAIVINHINKEEEFAGLEALQHEVDATLIFTIHEDELRELRSNKNRNGLPATLHFDMTDTGLVGVSEEEIERRDDEALEEEDE